MEIKYKYFYAIHHSPSIKGHTHNEMWEYLSFEKKKCNALKKHSNRSPNIRLLTLTKRPLPEESINYIKEKEVTAASFLQVQGVRSSHSLIMFISLVLASLTYDVSSLLDALRSRWWAPSLMRMVTTDSDINLVTPPLDQGSKSPLLDNENERGNYSQWI